MSDYDAWKTTEPDDCLPRDYEPTLAEAIEWAVQDRKFAWVASVLSEHDHVRATPEEAIWIAAELARRGLHLFAEKPGVWLVVKEIG